MKTLYLIGGTMGVGKTTACRLLKKTLDRAVFLDGDWCWDADPFVVNDETRAMVMDNICHLLNSYIHCSCYENILFCWVMHEQAVIDGIVSRLDLRKCAAVSISLVCSPEALRARLERDIRNGLRQPDVVERSLRKLSRYEGLSTEKIDTSGLSPEEVAAAILRARRYGPGRLPAAGTP